MKLARCIGGIMFVVVVCFVGFALGHPEMSFPWGNDITYLLYLLYGMTMIFLWIAPFFKK